MVPRKWVDDLKDVEGTRVCGHVSQPVPMCCRRRGHTITYLVFQIEKLLSAAATLRLVRSQIGACMDAAAQLLRTGLTGALVGTQVTGWRGTAGHSAVHLVAGSTTSPVLAQIARKRSLKTGSCSHAGSVCSYPVQQTRCGVLATRLGRD